jgi:hypothetical protein
MHNLWSTNFLSAAYHNTGCGRSNEAILKWNNFLKIKKKLFEKHFLLLCQWHFVSVFHFFWKLSLLSEHHYIEYIGGEAPPYFLKHILRNVADFISDSCFQLIQVHWSVAKHFAF